MTVKVPSPISKTVVMGEDIVVVEDGCREDWSLIGEGMRIGK